MEHELAKTFWNIVCLDTCRASQKYACLIIEKFPIE